MIVRGNRATLGPTCRTAISLAKSGPTGWLSSIARPDAPAAATGQFGNARRCTVAERVLLALATPLVGAAIALILFPIFLTVWMVFLRWLEKHYG